MKKIAQIREKAKKEIENARNLKELDNIFKKYLGKKGKITQILRSLSTLPSEERIKLGKEANSVKRFLSQEIRKKATFLHKKEIDEKEEKEWLDISLPGEKILLGHLHPLTKVIQEIEGIFHSLGFSVVEGPEIETAYYNFDALNIPPEHPARDMWDTFWLRQNEIKNQKSKIKDTKNLSTKTSHLLLRTHTSPVQIRYMEKYNPPLRIIAPGRCFRHEATDCAHDIQFYQLEGLMVDKEVSAANFKAIIQEFFRRFFKKNIEIRLRPSYFPFTEPSFEVDMSCLNCQGKGCSVCQKTGWMEMMGAGMVHPAVFKRVGLNPKNWKGFAFGLGIDRLVMMKYKIDDIRLFYSGDLRFLKQF